MIVLTGGAGFIGSVMLKKLNDEGVDDVIIIDNLRNTDKWKNLVNKEFEDYKNKLDFRNDYVAMEFGDCEAIIHLGACTSTTERDSDYLMDNNYKASKELAMLADEYDIPFIYASSAATYGGGKYGYSDELFSPLSPLNCYGYSKHAFDLWVLKNNLDKKFVGLKFFNV
ncbi:MAG: ADP-L-glycero-D-mannoheptose-6-epimerase, partial [Bacteroidetes bacterium 4572_77]